MRSSLFSMEAGVGHQLIAANPGVVADVGGPALLEVVSARN